MTRFVVTGGSGYLGQNLVREMRRRGFGHKNIDIKVGLDVTGPVDILRSICKEASVIYHLAAMPDVQYSIKDPLMHDRINVHGTLRMLEAARVSDVPFVFISSFAAKDPKSPYGLQKKIGEDYCKLYSELYGLRTYSLRLSNLYGGPNYVENKESVIAVFTKQLIKGGPITVFGGDQTRDFVHVDDVVDAILRVTRSEKRNETYEICSGSSLSIKELADIFLCIDPTLKVEYLDYMPGEVMSSVGDPSLARKDFGYGPKVRPEDGIEHLVEMIRGN